LLLAIVAVRLVFNVLLRDTANRLAAQHGRDATHKDGSKLLEEMWVLLGNCIMLVSATYIMLYRNGGCWFANTASCMAGWPDHVMDPAVALYYNAELAWYTHLLLKPVLRYGLPDGRDMMAHHVASLALLLLSGGLGMGRIGEILTCLFFHAFFGSMGSSLCASTVLCLPFTCCALHASACCWQTECQSCMGASEGGCMTCARFSVPTAA